LRDCYFARHAISKSRGCDRNIAGGMGHNLPPDVPETFAQAIINVDKV
jgi:hypothetical protein